MPGEFVFEADFILNVQNVVDVVKRIEGSLAKTGLAYEKEVSGMINKTTDGAAKRMSQSWGNIAQDVIGSAFNPLISSKEKLARAIPQAAGAGARLAAGIKVLGTGLSDSAVEKIGQQVERGISAALQRSNYVYSGARDATASYARNMARIGATADEGTLTKMASVQAQIRKDEYDAMIMARKASDKAFGTGTELESQGIKDVMSSVKDTLENFLDTAIGYNKMVAEKISEGLDKLGETIISNNKE